MPSDTEARLEAIYARARASFAENLATITMAIDELQTGALDASGQRAAERAAHRLVGAAGTVGFPEATAPARRLEDAFTEDVRPDVAPLLHADADALRGILFGLGSAPGEVDAARRVSRYPLNPAAVEHARALIDARQYVLDSDWDEVQPGVEAQNAYLENHSWEEYAAWHLGLTQGTDSEAVTRCAFVYGDLHRLHRTGLIACAHRASESRHKDIELAARHLLQALDAATLGT